MVNSYYGRDEWDLFYLNAVYVISAFLELFELNSSNEENIFEDLHTLGVTCGKGLVRFIAFDYIFGGQGLSQSHHDLAVVLQTFADN